MIASGGVDRRPFFVFCGTLIFLVLFCGFAAASGGGEAGGAEDGGRLLDLFYRGINFTLLVVILFVVIRKTPIKDFFSSRKEEIKKGLDDLKREKMETEARFRALDIELKAFEAKKKQIIDQFIAEGTAEKQKIIAYASDRAAQILAQADLTIAREIQAARDRLMQEVADVSADKAREIIAKEIIAGDQDHLVDEFIKKVEKLH